MTTDTITNAERVALGAAQLDATRPGWWQRINLDTLDLGDPCHCVLGQEYGHFDHRPEEVDFHEVDFGFDRPAAPRTTRVEAAADYEALTAEWRRIITERRATATS